MRAREYDAIIVGASFAGLAVARELRGGGAPARPARGGFPPDLRLRHPAVGSPSPRCGRERAPGPPARRRPPALSDAPYCTFDYGKFSRGLLEQSRARFLRTSVIWFADSAVETTEGRFRAPCLVDCSGWQGVLVDAANEGVPPGPAKSFGLETETDYRGEALYFWANPERFREGVAWLFPTGRGSRVGLASYLGRTKLKGALQRFVRPR